MKGDEGESESERDNERGRKSKGKCKFKVDSLPHQEIDQYTSSKIVLRTGKKRRKKQRKKLRKKESSNHTPVQQFVHSLPRR